jgi:hypothetical protein
MVKGLVRVWVGWSGGASGVGSTCGVVLLGHQGLPPGGGEGIGRDVLGNQLGGSAQRRPSSAAISVGQTSEGAVSEDHSAERQQWEFAHLTVKKNL